jgi:hypothetical protein
MKNIRIFYAPAEFRTKYHISQSQIFGYVAQFSDFLAENKNK